MALLDFIGTRDKSTAATPSQTQGALDAPGKKPTEAPTPLLDDPVASKGASSPPPTSDPPAVSQANESDVPPVAVAGLPDSATRTPNTDRRRWSFQGQFKLLRKPNAQRSAGEEHDAAVPTAASAELVKPPALSHADRRAKQSALIVRSLIVGQDTDEGGVASPPRERVSSAQMKNVKALLLEPKTAVRVITHLKALPALSNSTSHASEPIQAVCLPYNDEEADGKKNLSKIRGVKVTTPTTTPATHTPSSPVGSATIDAVLESFRNLHIVSLFTAPDLGLGEPGDGQGLLAGAIPTAETVINGVTEITPQLMALGYATGKNLIPSHKGIYPPTDRMSVLTYWWGLELLLPPPTLAYLSRARSISGTIMNVLTALSVMYAGVREIVPFVRYFSQYIDFEFNSIKAQDRGKGVICAATWIMPAALVPRPWDFPDPPKSLNLQTVATPPAVKTPITVLKPTFPSQTAPPVSQPSSSGVVPGLPASPSPTMPNSAPIEP